MKRIYVLVPTLTLALATTGTAQDIAQSQYPPGLDCTSIPGGSEREACEESQLSPEVGDDLNEHRSTTGAEERTPGTVSPPTFPDEPDGETRDSGPGTQGGAGGVGN
ncbi:hypothetical protein [Dongia deserti]|uniref:hypothetical protein n=1 Tax=Dongia deserti TaxID=2268030 RepID=UPI000E65D27B|nr:hypothetical protein [Dongia deserti]